MKEIIKAGVIYTIPEVSLLTKTPIAVAEIGARICYDSFDKAINEDIKTYEFGDDVPKDTGRSELVESLSHVYHHESIAEHVYLTFHIKNMSRGVLQELARHRIASFSVRSTRYTMGELLIAWYVFRKTEDVKGFVEYVTDMNTLVTKGFMSDLEIKFIYDRLNVHSKNVGEAEIYSLILSRDQMEFMYDNSGIIWEPRKLIGALIKLKGKRNVGDNFKYLVSDNFATELLFTINLRSFKNFISLRDSGAAYFLIQSLARDMFDAIPEEYQKVVRKSKD